MKKTLKDRICNFGIATGIAATVLFHAGSCISNLESGSSESSYKVVRLGVTDSESIPFSQCKAICIQYMGMVHPLSFQVLGRTNDGSVSYPSNVSKIRFYEYDFDILKITPDSLVVRYKIPE